MTKISRRSFLKTMGIATSGIAFPSLLQATATSAKTPTRPNVILIFCDDLGWGDLGAFWQNHRAYQGLAHIDTPHLDAVMRDGVMLTNAYTTAPVCAPARASMVTGKHQGHCSMRDNTFDCPIDPRITIGTVMKTAGYDTWHLGKWGIGGGYESNVTSGFGIQPRRAMACDAGFDYSYGYPAHGHGHSFYHWCKKAPGKNVDWRNAREGSPIVENVSANIYQAQDPYAKRYLSLSAGADGTTFEKDTEGNYYRRLIADLECRYCYDTDLFTAKMKQLILNHKEAQREKPFFCYACYTTVHGSGSRNNQGDMTLKSLDHFHVPGAPYPALDPNDTTWGGGVKWVKDNRGFLPFKEGGASPEGNTSNTYIHPDYRSYDNASKRRYATNVRRLDDAVGDLVNFLKLHGLYENTMIIFTSDNGPAGEYLNPGGIAWVDNQFDSNGPFKGMKRWCYEGGLREPTFVVWPKGIPASNTAVPRQCDVPFQFPSWMATLADVAGLPAPAHCDGTSILPALTQQGQQRLAPIYCEYVDGGSGKGFGFEQMMRLGDYTIIRNRGLSGKAELYNVVRDPEQRHNLANDPAEAQRYREMTDNLLRYRLPPEKQQAAYAAPANAYYNRNPQRAAVDAAPIPAIAPALNDQPRLFKEREAYVTEGAESWPWVPQLNAMTGHASDITTCPQACGITSVWWINLQAEEDITFTAQGEGGLHLWLHGAHIMGYEAGDCKTPHAITLRLAQGRHPLRVYQTTQKGTAGLTTWQITP